MSIPGSASPLFFQTAAADAAAAGPIKSVRFNSGDSAYLNRTPSSAGNRRTWTWSAWVKRSKLGERVALFTAATDNIEILFEPDDKLRIYFYPGSYAGHTKTVASFRDTSAWYHIVFAIDTTQTGNDNIAKIYVNGVQQEVTHPNNWTQNSETNVNNTVAHYIGSRYGPGRLINAYMADIYLIDGSALDPTSFGAFDTNGVWQAAAYSGTFGTNGFHLFDFASESTVGHDSSGNENDFTANNISQASLTTWSNGWSNNLLSGFPATNCFNGTGTGLTIGGSNVKSTWTAPSSIPFTTLSIRGSHDGANIKVNGTDVTSQFSSGLTIVTVTGISSPLTSIDLDNTNGQGNARISAIRIDGELLADATPYPGAGNDVLFDVPTNGDSSNDTGAGGEVSGNYPSWNPLCGQNHALLNGNLQAESGTISSYATIPSTIAMTSGKWYAEFQYIENINAQGDGSNFMRFGISQIDRNFESGGPLSTAKDFGFFGSSTSFRARTNGSNTYTYSGITLADGDILSLAFDADSGKLWCAKNGTYLTNAGGTGDPAAGNYPDFSSLTYSGGYVFVAGPYAGAASPAQGGGRLSSKLIANWGQRDFAYAAPSGFKALNTASLPTPTIADGSDYFDAAIYTGTGSNITVPLGFEPDLVWTKCRSAVSGHVLQNSVSGITTKYLQSQGTDQEYDGTGGVQSTSSTGFVQGTGSGVNVSGETYVSWAWDAGTSNASNTDGDITSSVRASQSAGFSIVSYTGNGTAGQTVGHGLNAAPEMIIVKNRDSALNWVVGHQGLDSSSPWTKNLYLNTSGTVSTLQSIWNNTAPTNSVFTVGASGTTNNNGSAYIALCFSGVKNYSQFGSYVGDGVANSGPFVFTSFRPAFLMIKGVDGGDHWYIYDSKRDGYNPDNEQLTADITDAEYAAANYPSIDFLSNGFKVRSGNNAGRNQSGITYMYMCFAEKPFQANGGLAR